MLSKKEPNVKSCHMIGLEYHFIAIYLDNDDGSIDSQELLNLDSKLKDGWKRWSRWDL